MPCTVGKFSIAEPHPQPFLPAAVSSPVKGVRCVNTPGGVVRHLWQLLQKVTRKGLKTTDSILSNVLEVKGAKSGDGDQVPLEPRGTV